MISFSIFGDLDKCFFTGIVRRGYPPSVEVHHVFGGATRSKCEVYGYVVPLYKSIHPNGASFNEKECKQLTGMTRNEVNELLRAICQVDYEKKHGTRQEFMQEFGKNYLDAEIEEYVKEYKKRLKGAL